MTEPSAVRKWLPHFGWPVCILLLWALLGYLGQFFIDWSWRAAQLGEFRRTVQAVAQLAGGQTWTQPWESDPAWQALEQQLDVDLVPLTEGQDQNVTWSRSPTGQWRASIAVPLANPSQRTVFVRGTRSFDNSHVNHIWWSTWSALNAIVLMCVLLVRKRQRWQLARDRENMLLWNAVAPPDHASVSSESEGQQLTTLLEKLREGVLCLDATSRIALINQNLCDQLELGEAANQIGRQLVEVVRVPGILEMVEHCSRSKNAVEQTIEVGSASRYLHILVMPIQLADEPDRVLLTATDVSSAQRSELARREFVTGASHELKTPLAAIRAYTETLQSIGQEDPETTERFLERILDQADRMDRLVNSMLQLARAESGNLKLKIQPIDAALAIKPCVEAAAGMAQAKSLRFQSRLPDQRTLVLADRDALQTIASNLLSNAIRYTPAGGEVVLELLPAELIPAELTLGTDQQREMVCLRVSDTGIGIAPADQARIFERFYRVQKDRSVDSGGTGLGLAIVKQLTQVLDGQVQVISQPGAGTRFEIRLPAVGFTQSSSNADGEATVSKR